MGNRGKEEGLRIKGGLGIRLPLTSGSLLGGRGFLRGVMEGDFSNMAKIFLNHINVRLA